MPAKDFWSVVLYDTQTRSMLQTDQQFPSLSSEKKLATNADGSVDIYFGPKAVICAGMGVVILNVDTGCWLEQAVSVNRERLIRPGLNL